jgi:hypothetical protein
MKLLTFSLSSIREKQTGSKPSFVPNFAPRDSGTEEW